MFLKKDNEVSEEKSKKEKLIINLDEEKIKAVSNTYSLYTSVEVEAGKKEDKVNCITAA